MAVASGHSGAAELTAPRLLASWALVAGAPKLKPANISGTILRWLSTAVSISRRIQFDAVAGLSSSKLANAA
jgi:hypothetical protein